MASQLHSAKDTNIGIKDFSPLMPGIQLHVIHGLITRKEKDNKRLFVKFHFIK
jgi:hypothetical protein